jgi:hypothetical protein
VNKKINLHLDPRDPNGSAQLLAALAREMNADVDAKVGPRDAAQPIGPTVTDSEQPPQRHDGQLAQKVGDAVRDDLDAKQSRIEEERKKNPVEPTPAERAKDIVKARKSLREIFREEGAKFTIQTIAKASWEHRVQAWETVKEFGETLRQMFSP